MILFGILGMEFTSDGIIFNPYIPWNMDEVVMKNIAYREMIINIEIKGKGSNINKFFINGQLYSENKLSAEMSGEKNIKIIVD
jgi:cellobiose phosphorylase